MMLNRYRPECRFSGSIPSGDRTRANREGMISPMEMHQIRYFLAVCDSLNFTRAAEACNVT